MEQTEAFLPPSPDFTLKKTERLCSKKAFELLFANGKSVLVYPIKIIYTSITADGPGLTQVAFGASKRNFKRANKRNLIKRFLRESYRKHKFPVKVGHNQYFMIIYIAKEIVNYHEIESTLIKALDIINTKIEKNS